MKISILTGTYNRADLLNKLYKSIIENCKSCNWQVEWLIMDDESTDNTRMLINQYIEENKLEIKYFYQKNSGKMVAINKLIKEATGDFILECDSDDYLADGAIRTIEQTVDKCQNTKDVYALVFLKYNQNNENMGNNFKEDNYESSMFDLYFKEGITGEKALVYNAEIRKKYQYELENNEKFVTEARMHHKMDLKYKVRCFNKKIMICEYKSDGYTKNINKIFKENPYGYYYYFQEIFEQNMKGIILAKRYYIYKHYILFSVLTHQKKILKPIKKVFDKLMIIILYIPGKIMTKIKFNME